MSKPVSPGARAGGAPKRRCRGAIAKPKSTPRHGVNWRGLYVRLLVDLTELEGRLDHTHAMLELARERLRTHGETLPLDIPRSPGPCRR